MDAGISLVYYLHLYKTVSYTHLGALDIAQHTLLLTLRVDAEAAGCKPEVSIVVKNHGQKILGQLLAKCSLGGSLDVDVQHLFKFGQHVAAFVCCAEHQHMIVARGADDAVGRI